MYIVSLIATILSSMFVIVLSVSPFFLNFFRFTFQIVLFHPLIIDKITQDENGNEEADEEEVEAGSDEEGDDEGDIGDNDEEGEEGEKLTKEVFFSSYVMYSNSLNATTVSVA